MHEVAFLAKWSTSIIITPDNMIIITPCYQNIVLIAGPQDKTTYSSVIGQEHTIVHILQRTNFLKLFIDNVFVTLNQTFFINNPWFST